MIKAFEKKKKRKWSSHCCGWTLPLRKIRNRLRTKLCALNHIRRDKAANTLGEFNDWWVCVWSAKCFKMLLWNVSTRPGGRLSAPRRIMETIFFFSFFLFPRSSIRHFDYILMSVIVDCCVKSHFSSSVPLLPPLHPRPPSAAPLLSTSDTLSPRAEPFQFWIQLSC